MTKCGGPLGSEAGMTMGGDKNPAFKTVLIHIARIPFVSPLSAFQSPQAVTFVTTNHTQLALTFP